VARRPTRSDLVARALGVLPEADRVRVDGALAQDPALRQRFEEIAGHLVRYDRLPPAPPAPPFERIAAAMDAEGRPDPGVLRLQRKAPRLRPALAWTFAGAAAALLIVALVVRSRWQDTPRSGSPVVAGPGLQVVSGDPTLLTCDRPAEARVGDRVRLVLDGGARLRVENEETVHLERGRAWFEVAPGPFRVLTPHGPVEVRGTAFEVDARRDWLEVAVAEGRVMADGHEVGPGEVLAQGVVALIAWAPGAWFRAPQLDLELARPEALAPGRPLDLRLVFHNAAHVPLSLQGPRAARTPVWIRFETRQGRTVGELPVLPANVTAGGDLLRPGGSVELPAGASSALTVRILPPPGCPPAYRCKALYRPGDQPAVLSSPLQIEVR
jgi:ferric-dicitrate binding protein FerR (iron transport regulator)